MSDSFVDELKRIASFAVKHGVEPQGKSYEQLVAELRSFGFEPRLGTEAHYNQIAEGAKMATELKFLLDQGYGFVLSQGPVDGENYVSISVYRSGSDQPALAASAHTAFQEAWDCLMKQIIELNLSPNTNGGEKVH